MAYKAHIISTIVDEVYSDLPNDAYKAHIISTIVDINNKSSRMDSLQGSYNFYYCR